MDKARQRLRCLSAAAVSAFLVVASNVAAVSQDSKMFTICVGNPCIGGDYKLGDGFMAANPHAIDQAAARHVCTVVNDFSKYTYSILEAEPGTTNRYYIVLARCRR